ncbi:MAG: ABC transporter substrate-binding protein [Alphaproteobacteria bacterium]|nr:ABC transporter substrate-binding protein [Alphaproteobacteria bacterium]
MRRTMILSAFVLALSGPAAFADEADAKRVVQTLGEQTVAANKIEDKDERRRSLLAAAAPAVDFKTIGAGVLAHAGVKVPGGREQEVMEGVIAYVSNQVINEIDRIRPEEAKVGEIKAKGEDEVRVPMQLAGVRDRIDADWVVKKSAEGWRVTDVMVSGASLTAHFGGTLARRSRGELEQLIEFLRAEQQRVRVAALQR